MASEQNDTTSETDDIFQSIVGEMEGLNHFERICIVAYSGTLSGLGDDICYEIATDFIVEQSTYADDIVVRADGRESAQELIDLLASDPNGRIFLITNVDNIDLTTTDSVVMKVLAYDRFFAEKNFDDLFLDATLVHIDAYRDENDDIFVDPYFEDASLWDLLGASIQEKFVLQSAGDLPPATLRRIARTGVPKNLVPAMLAHPAASRGVMRILVEQCTPEDHLALHMIIASPLSDERTRQTAMAILAKAA